jgi:hypothetical protein
LVLPPPFLSAQTQPRKKFINKGFQ